MHTRSFARILSVLALIVFGFSTPPLRADTAEADMDKVFEQANEQVEKGEYTKAMELYNKVLEDAPEADNALIGRAICKYHLNDMSGAKADLSQAIKVNPERPEVFNLRGQLRFAGNELSKALDDYNRAVELAEDNPEYRARRAETQQRLGNLSAALEDIDRVLREHEDFAAGYLVRAVIFLQDGSPVPASVDYTKYLELVPDDMNAVSSRAWVFVQLRDWDHVMADADRILAAIPDSPVGIRLQGYALYSQGKYAKAADVLEKLAAVDAGLESAYGFFIRYLALRRLGQKDALLPSASGGWDKSTWEYSVARFLGGKMDEDTFEALIDKGDSDEAQATRTCEGNFYIGMLRLIAGDKSTARLRFKTSIGAGRTSFIEHALALDELDKLK